MGRTVYFIELLGVLVLATLPGMQPSTQNEELCSNFQNQSDFQILSVCPKIPEKMLNSGLQADSTNAPLLRAQCLQRFVQDPAKANARTFRTLAAAQQRAGLFTSAVLIDILSFSWHVLYEMQGNNVCIFHFITDAPGLF